MSTFGIICAIILFLLWLWIDSISLYKGTFFVVLQLPLLILVLLANDYKLLDITLCLSLILINIIYLIKYFIKKK